MPRANLGPYRLTYKKPARGKKPDLRTVKAAPVPRPAPRGSTPTAQRRTNTRGRAEHANARAQRLYELWEAHKTAAGDKAVWLADRRAAALKRIENQARSANDRNFMRRISPDPLPNLKPIRPKKYFSKVQTTTGPRNVSDGVWRGSGGVWGGDTPPAPRAPNQIPRWKRRTKRLL